MNGKAIQNEWWRRCTRTYGLSPTGSRQMRITRSRTGRSRGLVLRAVGPFLHHFIIGARYHACLDYLAGGRFIMGLPRFSLFPVERRNSPREPMHYIIKLKFDDESPWLRGLLNNLSAGGACVSISTTKEIPAEFTLVFPENNLRRCRLVWRSGDRMGVEFLI